VVFPITNLLKGFKNGKKLGPFIFREATKQAINQLKDLFILALILIYFHWELYIYLKTDIFSFALGAILF